MPSEPGFRVFLPAEGAVLGRVKICAAYGVGCRVDTSCMKA